MYVAGAGRMVFNYFNYCGFTIIIRRVDVVKEKVKFKCPGCGDINEKSEDIIFSTCDCETKITQEDRL